jgi:uncharacterized membrane protein
MAAKVQELVPKRTLNMVTSFRLLFIRCLLLLALSVSAGQLADHVAGVGAFCSFDSCEQVTTSVYGKPFGVPLPLIGLIGFSVVFTLSLVPSQWAIRLVWIFSLLAGVVGIGLLLIQLAVLHTLCPFCLVVDFAAIGLAGVAWRGLPEPVPVSRFRLLGWIIAGAMLVMIPVGWTAAIMPEPIPAPVEALWEPGEITIVEVTDFECPFCRQTDAIFRDVLSRHKVRFVRLVAPLPLHENGVPAARAYIAARQLGKGEEMAAELFAADSRAPTRCRELAGKLGLNLAEYDRLCDEAATDAEIRATIGWSRNLGGLPMIWVQQQFIKGVPTASSLEEAIRNAKPAGQR